MLKLRKLKKLVFVYNEASGFDLSYTHKISLQLFLKTVQDRLELSIVTGCGEI